MEPSSLALEMQLVNELRQRRAELRESMSALEQALASPMSAGPAHWVERVKVALVELSSDFRAHIDVTEGPDGLYRELRGTAPRLSHQVASLALEHLQITDLLEALLVRADQPLEQAESIREAATELLGILMRHRQRGADLLFEAYDFDIGGET